MSRSDRAEQPMKPTRALWQPKPPDFGGHAYRLHALGALRVTRPAGQRPCASPEP